MKKKARTKTNNPRTPLSEPKTARRFSGVHSSDLRINRRDLINIGVTLNDQRKFAEAITYLTRAVELQPQSSKAHLQLALSLPQKGLPDEALGHFYKALDFAPNDSEVRTDLGLMLARMGKIAEAREQLSTDLRLNPNSPEAHNNLCLVLLMQGDPDKSILEFSATLRLTPGFSLAQENLDRAQAQIKARQE